MFYIMAFKIWIGLWITVKILSSTPPEIAVIVLKIE